MKSIQIFPLVLFSSAVAINNVAAKNTARPNILVILSDDMGYSDLGCYGGVINTPNLDALANNGVKYTQFYNSARSCPSRASLLTGLAPHQAGIGEMISGRPTDPVGYRGDLNNQSQTIAEVLAPAGYETFAVGKWHVTKSTTAKGPKNNWPRQRGFEHFYGTITGAGSYYDPSTLCRDNTFITPRNDDEYKPETYYYTNAIGDNALKYLKNRDSERPFFMYLAFTAAHWPMQALERDVEPYKGKFDMGWDKIREQKLAQMKKMGVIAQDAELSHDKRVHKWDDVQNKEFETRCMEVYGGIVSCMDNNIGHIVDYLRKTNQLDNTLILFLQDNGGCAEKCGRNSKTPKPIPIPKGGDLNPMADDQLQLSASPYKTRDGVRTMQGVGVEVGPDGTYVGYGQNWANVSNTPFREYKHFIHEGGISTPLIAHWPNGIKAKGQIRTQPSHLIDIMATCVELSKATYPKVVKGEKIHPLEGISLTRSFNSQIEQDKDRVLCFEHQGNRGVRIGDWKAVYKKSAPYNYDIALSDWELYNIKEDRSELHNKATEHPQILAKLVKEWETYAERCLVKPWRKKRK